MRVSAERRAALRRGRGSTTPRLWTKPLRELTPETSHGFHVIEFAERYLGVQLRPWQKWLLIHALELLVDGTYRFRKIVIIVGRQNGKTKLIEVLSTWWLFVDSESFPEHVPAHEFLVLGTAQDVGTAKKVWEKVLAKCDPDVLRWPERFTPAERAQMIPLLAKQAAKPSRQNSSEAIILQNGAQYQIAALASAAARGDSTSRAVLDELREQRKWDGWAAFSKTMNGTFNSQMWAISSAGDARSVVLADLRDAAIAAIQEWEAFVDSGLIALEEYANTHDISNALFEWSSPDGQDVTDPDGIFQANPSIGFGYNIEALLSDLESGEPEHVTRTEVRCEWVNSTVEPHISGTAWEDCADPYVDALHPGSMIADDSPLALGVDTSHDRSMTYIAVAGYRDDGIPHVELIVQRAHMLWLPKFLPKLREKSGVTRVAIQARGCAASEFVPHLTDSGLEVVPILGTALGASLGQAKDRIEARTLRHRSQQPLNLSTAGAVARELNQVFVIDRSASPTDSAPFIAMCNALYALENTPHVEPLRSAYEDSDLLVI